MFRNTLWEGEKKIMLFSLLQCIFVLAVCSAHTVLKLLDEVRNEIGVPAYTPEQRIQVAQTIKTFLQVNSN